MVQYHDVYLHYIDQCIIVHQFDSLLSTSDQLFYSTTSPDSW